MSVEVFASAFPVLTSIAGGSGFLVKLAEMEQHFQGDRSALTTPRAKHSRGFWNTCGAWCFDERIGSKASAAFRLAIIEAGLTQAARVGKAGKFSKALLRDEEGFEDAVAELRLLGALGPAASTVDLERPGKTAGRNYDVHLAWDDGTELHLDSKRRGPENEIGTLNGARQLDVEQLLGRHFNAFAWLCLNKNFYASDNALHAAIIVDECRRIAFDAPGEMSSISADSLPDWLVRSSVANLACMGLIQGRKVLAVRVNGHPAIFMPDEQTFWVDHEHVGSVRLLEGGDQHGYCFIIPAAESQPMLTVEARLAWNDTSTHDRRNPDSLAYKGLMSKALGQLPVGPLNVIAVAIETSFDFEDVELAVIGEPVPDEATQTHRRDHGIIHDEAYDEISGVLAFTVTPPDATSGAASVQEARFWPNPRCANHVPSGLAEAVCKALSAAPT
jgi:hypothetical protein